MTTQAENLASKVGTLARIALGVVTVALLAMWAAQKSGVLAGLGICVTILLSSAAVGAALGFIFVLPRVLVKDDSAGDSSGNGVKVANDGNQPAGKRLLGTNNNLEKVSDWLTTIIVGVGLTQLRSIDSGLYEFRVFIEKTARVFPDGGKCVAACSAGFLPTVAPMILIFGLVIGFLFLYLYTRLIIVGLLKDVESALQALKQPLPPPAAAAFNSIVKTVPGATENVSLSPASTGAAPSVGEGLELMGSLLYVPDRYQDVIDLAGQLSNTTARNRPEYWLYQAAAFGQKHQALKQQGAESDELQSARDNALDAARRAVGIDPLMRDRLWAISEPEGVDDDLSDFRSDPDFLKLTGRWRKSS